MKWDALVVGAGIAGLVAALRLQLGGRRTVVVERSSRAGGLCGTVEVDGYTFASGCNDFGSGFERMLGALGVDVAFHHPRARFHFGPHRIELPPDARTLGRLMWRFPAALRAWRGSRRAATLGELVDGWVGDPLLADLACLPAYAMMRSPDDVSLTALKADFSKELAYGYDRSCTPVGGPAALIERMVARYVELGGTLLLGREWPGDGELAADAVVSSVGRWDEAPPGSRPGLEVGLALLVVRADAPWPAGYHTVDWFAPGVAAMLRSLDRGEPVAEPSFHAFCCDLPAQGGCRTITAFVPLARGDQGSDGLVEHVRRTLVRLIPGLEVVHATFLGPDAYAARLGHRPRPSPLVLPPGTPKPPSYDPARGIRFVGTSVDPPGEHAGAAALSGWRAAGAILEGADVRL